MWNTIPLYLGTGTDQDPYVPTWQLSAEKLKIIADTFMIDSLLRM